ncbi:MAG: NAD+ synthase [Bacteroidales bacterium]|nr:NAD+ synthase [Bacteroidales bacterium]
MRIALAQLNYKIGAFTENVEKMVSAIREAKQHHADLVVFSELSVCGYPPLDLLENKSFIDRGTAAVGDITKETDGIAVIIGLPTLNTQKTGKNLFNSALFIADGEIRCECHKSLLPTYDIFDEYRYFQPADKVAPVQYKGKKIAITICEDLWFQQPLLTNFGKHKIYTSDPMKMLGAESCDLIINIAASPFAYNHEAIKTEILRANAGKYKTPIVYVNQVGAHTELIFDGGSRVLDADGRNVLRLKSFIEELAYFDTDKPVVSHQNSEPSDTDRIHRIHDALILGIHDYFRKMRFSKAVLGLSGGIDSAVTLVLAKEALGRENVRVLLMPSQYSSDHSVSDAIKLAENLGVRYDTLPIKDIFNQFLDDLGELFRGTHPDIAEENIQARIRGTLLMAISNKFGNLLLNTSNKSEVAVGYGTLYGDMNGGISVLGDVYKTDVYKLARYINRENEVIPEHTLVKPPSAELRPDQKDSDSLPDYDLLDQVLYQYIERRMSGDEIIAAGFEEGMVWKTLSMVNSNEYKRFQTPPILRVSSKAFGFGRRMPLVAKYF